MGIINSLLQGLDDWVNGSWSNIFRLKKKVKLDDFCMDQFSGCTGMCPLLETHGRIATRYK